MNLGPVIRARQRGAGRESMELYFDVNGTRLDLGATADPDRYKGAGFREASFLKRWRLGVPNGIKIWQVEDPRIHCFGEQIEIYPCRDSYLDPDRRWRTQCNLTIRHNRLIALEAEIIDGVYSAGNMFERFQEVGVEWWGRPHIEERRQFEWHQGPMVIAGSLDHRARHAVFRWEIQESKAEEA